VNYLPPRAPERERRNGGPTSPAAWRLEPPRPRTTSSRLELAGIAALALTSGVLVGLGIWKLAELVARAL
jgi:hypothetical protein